MEHEHKLPPPKRRQKSHRKMEVYTNRLFEIVNLVDSVSQQQVRALTKSIPTYSNSSKYCESRPVQQPTSKTRRPDNLEINFSASGAQNKRFGCVASLLGTLRSYVAYVI